MYHEKLNPIEEHVHKLDVDEVSMFYLDRHMPAMDSIALGNKKLYYCDKGRTAIIATALAGLAALTYAIPQAREAAISVYQWYQFCSDYSQTAPYLTRLGLRTIANIPLTSAFFGTGDIFAQYITKGKVDDIERLKKTFAMGVYNGIEFTLLYAGINALFNFDYGLPEIANKAVNSAGMVAIDPYAYLWVAHARHVDWMSKKEADLKLSDLLKWWSPSINIRETKRLFKQKDFKEKWDGVTSYARKFWTKFHFINRTFTPERYQILPTWVAVIPFTIYLALQSNKTAGPAKLRDTILDSIEKQTPS